MIFVSLFRLPRHPTRRLIVSATNPRHAAPDADTQAKRRMKCVAAALLATTCVAATQAAGIEKAKLHYFDVRGLGQAPRLMLSDLGIEFREERHTKATWPEKKQAGIESGIFPFGQMPVLEYQSGGRTGSVAQSLAIMQFLARSHDRYGAGTPESAAVVDVLAGGTGDLRKRYGAFVYNKQAQEDPKLLEGYVKEIGVWVPFYDSYLKKHAAAAGSFVGGADVPSYADVLLFDLIDTCVLRIKPDALANFPHLAAHYAAVGSRAGIKKYLESEQNHKFANGPSSFFDNQAHSPLKREEEL